VKVYADNLLNILRDKKDEVSAVYTMRYVLFEQPFSWQRIW